MCTYSSIFPAQLLQSGQRLTHSQKVYSHRLDKNEQPDDLPDWLKMQVLQKVMHMEWNRYPEPANSDIEEQIAATLELTPEKVVLGAGSASFITALLNYFGMQRRQIVITQPSYSLFDYHCKTYGISYQPWMLNDSLSYDMKLLPVLEEGSALFIVSPNNPVGNTISRSMLVDILTRHPRTLVVLDAVYAAFDAEDFSDLLSCFDNLVILRSLSKELPVAGLRLGYLCGPGQIADVIRKLLLPFSINPLSLAFARHMLFDADFLAWAAESRIQIQSERDRMFAALTQDVAVNAISVLPSSGNFLLIKVYSGNRFSAMLSAFSKAGIKILDTSGMPLLANTFRVSIGSFAANNEVLGCMAGVLRADGVPA